MPEVATLPFDPPLSPDFWQTHLRILKGPQGPYVLSSQHLRVEVLTGDERRQNLGVGEPRGDVSVVISYKGKPGFVAGFQTSSSGDVEVVQLEQANNDRGWPVTNGVMCPETVRDILLASSVITSCWKRLIMGDPLHVKGVDRLPPLIQQKYRDNVTRIFGMSPQTEGIPFARAL